jgi:hypothetical protein
MRADDFVRNRSARHRDAHHVATRPVYGLANGFGYFVGFAGCESNASLTVADGDERVEGKAASALHHFRDAIDCDHVLDELAATIAASAVTVPSFALATASATTATLALTARAATLTAGCSATTPCARTTTSATATTAASTTTAAAAACAAARARSFLRWG